MNGVATAVLLLASIVSLAGALLTVRQRGSFWLLTSVQQLGFAFVAALAAVTLAAHSPGLDLTAMAAALALLALTIYAWHVKARRPAATR